MKAYKFFNYLDDAIPVSIYDEAGNILYEGILWNTPFEVFENRDFITAQWSGEHGDLEIQVTGRMSKK